MENKLSAQSLKRPKWWLFVLLMPGMAGMIFAEHRFNQLPIVHQIVGVGMILLIYGLMAVWLWINSDSLASQPAPYAIFDDSEPTRKQNSEPIRVCTFDEIGETWVYKISELGQVFSGMEDKSLSEELRRSADSDIAETLQAIEEALLIEYENEYEKLSNCSGMYKQGKI